MTVPQTPRRIYTDRRFLATVATLGILALAIHVLLREPADGMEHYPHAFLEAAGYDPAQVSISYAAIEEPPDPPPGCQRAWRCDDPAFNDRDGRPWLFPMIASGEQRPDPPKHPTLRRSPALERCSLYRTPEAAALLDAYRARRSP